MWILKTNLVTLELGIDALPVSHKEQMKKKVRKVYIIDESGSMNGQRTETVEGFQQDLINLKEEEDALGNIEYYVTVVTFNIKKKILVDNVRLSELELDFDKAYRPGGGTALNQTVGEVLELIDPSETNVLVTIMTDGQEADSVGEYANAEVLKAFVKDRESKKWAFVFIGANLDTQRASRGIGISNNISYTVDNTGGAYNAMRNARVAYTCSVSDDSVDNSGLFRGFENCTVNSKSMNLADTINIARSVRATPQTVTNQTT
jgi:uncharacterized protein YegL